MYNEDKILFFDRINSSLANVKLNQNQTYTNSLISYEEIKIG